MKKILLVTGATSGFGKAIAEKFARNNFDIIITGRREERLKALQEQISRDTGSRVHSVAFDVRNREEVFRVLGSLPDEWKQIDVLINNAGLAMGRDSFDKASIDDWDTMIDTNIKGLLYVTKAVLPYMLKKTNSQVINVGSTAAKEVYDKGNVYCATKHAVEAISQAMRIDLLPHRIKVTAIHPGAAETEFSIVRFKGDEEMAKKVYEGFEPLHPEDIAEIALYCASLPPHVCINDLVVTCTAQANSFYFNK